MRARIPLERVVILEKTHGAILEEIRQLAQETGVLLQEATAEGFNRYTTATNAQGVLAITGVQPEADLRSILLQPTKQNSKGIILVLDQIEDPRNLGALVRTAECAGIHAVVIPRHRSASVSTGAIKASAGATVLLPIAEVSNLVQALEFLKQHAYWIIGLDAKSTKRYTDVDYTDSVAIVVGSEAKGLRRLVREHCDFLVSIPMYGRIGSLNASVAGALVMYEARRQRTSVSHP
jgi:23S rRNA (guanosine2251-2'-O)-methyltransferase